MLHCNIKKTPSTDFDPMNIQKILCLTLLLTLCLNPLASAAQLNSCTGKEGCPHCIKPMHASEHAPKKTAHFPAGCCDETDQSACEIEKNLSYSDFGYTVTTRRTNYLNKPLHFAPTVDFLDQFKHSTVFNGQIQNPSHPFSTPIYINHLSLLC